jgi:NAD(P)-dependent dehydrogenase (short-subunit alcohol dehydrogenase family)
LRNEQRASAAVQSLKSESGNTNIQFMLLNLALLASVRRFADDFIRSGNYLYGLVCNAASNSNDHTSKTEDGFEATFGVCHLGHFLLVNLLLPSMVDNGRVVFVASDMHNPPKMFGTVTYPGAQELAYPKEDKGMLNYSLSKLCNIYCAYELSRRLQADGRSITANAFNPGMMNDTGFSRGASPMLAFVNKVVAPAFDRFQGRLGSSEKSGKALADMIIDEKYNRLTGKYIDRGKEVKSSTLSYNEDNARELWGVSVELVGM